MMAALRAALAAVLLVAQGCSDAPKEPAWTTASGPNPGMLFSVWGASGDDVWAVGGCDDTYCPGKPHALILHKVGGAWTPVASPVDVPIWWVYGFSTTNVWFAGEKGTVLHFDGSKLSAVPSAADASSKLFGIWGASPDDVWAVGGAPDVTSTVVRWNGSAFSRVADAPVASDGKYAGTWYKVWGASRGDVYLVGQRGAVAHFDGMMWSTVDVSAAGVTSRDGLFTVAGRGSNDVWVVGGQPGQGLAIHWDGGKWLPGEGLKLDGVQLLTGVSVTAAGDVAITGFNSAKFVGKPGAFRDDTKKGALADWHAVWMRAPDDIYTAGGDFASEKGGLVGHYGL